MNFNLISNITKQALALWEMGLVLDTNSAFSKKCARVLYVNQTGQNKSDEKSSKLEELITGFTRTI